MITIDDFITKCMTVLSIGSLGCNAPNVYFLKQVNS